MMFDSGETQLNLGIEGFVYIPGSGGYIKSEEAFGPVYHALVRLGYEIEELSHNKGRPAKHIQLEKRMPMFFAKLGEDFAAHHCRCCTCRTIIDPVKANTHGNECVVCGDPTYLRFQNGHDIIFTFANDMSEHRIKDIRMNVHNYDEQLGCLLLYPEPLSGTGIFSSDVKSAKKALTANRDKFRRIRRRVKDADGKSIRTNLIAIPFDIKSHNIGVINISQNKSEMTNFFTVTVYEGKEYHDFESLPVPRAFSIYEAWHWAPLQPTDDLPSRIISAAGMVSNRQWLTTGGRDEYYDISLLRMRIFVENLTTIPIDQWDAMIEKAPRTGLGMLEAIEEFCRLLAEEEKV